MKTTSSLSGFIAAILLSMCAQTSARPADFDTFWNLQLEKLESVSVGTVLTFGKFAPETIPAGLVYSQFSLAVSPTERVRGQLAHPDVPGENYPALVIFQWAGVYPLQTHFVTVPAQEGWLVVNVYPHDQPFDEAAEFYKELEDGPLKHYWAIHADDRERSYFLRMFLGTRRVLDIVKTHPAWDGRIIVAKGTSQGGSQALVAAALDPAVTAVLANVPALCDLHGGKEGRADSFPFWLQQTEDRDPEAVSRAAEYFDIVHFAPRIKVPVLIGAGEADKVCAPGGIARAADALAGPKEFILMPKADHQGTDNTHAPFLDREKTWLEELRNANAPPLISSETPAFPH